MITNEINKPKFIPNKKIRIIGKPKFNRIEIIEEDSFKTKKLLINKESHNKLKLIANSFNIPQSDVLINLLEMVEIKDEYTLLMRFKIKYAIFKFKAMNFILNASENLNKISIQGIERMKELWENLTSIKMFILATVIMFIACLIVIREFFIALKNAEW